MGIDCARVEVISTMRRNQNREEPPQLLVAISRLWQVGRFVLLKHQINKTIILLPLHFQLGFPINFDRIFGHPSWDWDWRIPGYQFDRIPLNSDGYEYLIPFCHGNEQIVEMGKKIQENDGNCEVKWMERENRIEFEEIVAQVKEMNIN